MRARARLVAVTALGLTLVGACGQTQTGSSGSCVAPIVTVTPTSVTPGGVVTVSGEWFFNTCDDVGAVADGTPLPRPSVGPDLGLSVVLMDGPAQRALATTDAGADGRFSVHVTIPADVAPGPTSIRVAPAPDDAPLTIEAPTGG